MHRFRSDVTFAHWTPTNRPALTLVAVFAWGLCLTAMAGAQNWPAFRGLNSSGLYQGPPPPVAWNGLDGINIVWKTPLPGFGHSSPVVWGDRVFVTSAVSRDPRAGFENEATSGRPVAIDAGAEQSWKVIALDKKSGKILWETTPHEGVQKIGRHPKASHADATPVTDGSHLFVFLGSEGLYTYDLDGHLLWKQDLGVLDAGYVGMPQFQWSTASSPIIYRNLVILQCDSRKDSFMAAYDLTTGERAWFQPRDENPSWATPVIFEGKNRAELLTSSPHYYRGLDPNTGKELWRFFDEADVKVPTPVVGNGLAFFMGGGPRGRQFYAIRPGGEGDISLKGEESESEHIAWKADKGAPYTPTPIFSDDFLYVLSDQGVLTRYNAGTGRRAQRKRVPATGGAFSASPVIANGLLYLASQDGDVHVVRADSELVLVQTNPVGEVLMATPALSEGMIFLRGSAHLFAIGRPVAAGAIDND